VKDVSVEEKLPKALSGGDEGKVEF